MPELPKLIAPFELPKRPLGGLERLFRTLDRPGNIVQTLLQGQPIAAAKHALNLGAELPTLGLYGPDTLPFVGQLWDEHLQTTKEEEPDWGFVGETLTDPLTYMSLGGVGAAKSVGAAATKKMAQSALREGLTKGGAKWLAKEGVKYADDLLPQLTRLSSKKTAADAARQAVRIGERRALREALRKTPEGFEIAGKLAQQGAGLLDEGGLKVLGKTVAMHGKDPLGWHPVSLALKSKPGQAVKRVLGKTFKRHFGLNPAERALARKFENNLSRGTAQWDEKIAEMIKTSGVAPENVDDVFGDIAAAIDGVDSRVLRASKERSAAVVDVAREEAAKAAARIEANPQVKAMKDQIAQWMGEVMSDEQATEIMKSNGIDPKDYLMRIYENAAELHKAAGDRLAEKTPDFVKGRKFVDIGDAWQFGYDPIKDPVERIRRRLSGHVYVDEMRQLTRDAGMLETIHKGLPTAALTDADGRYLARSALTDWIAKGAGRIGPQGMFDKIFSKVNRPFKMGVTAGLGPLPNLAFHTRNFVSGLFQGLTDEKIGMKAFGIFRPKMWRFVRNMDNPQALAKMRGAGAYSAQEVADLVRKHGVLGSTFSTTEIAKYSQIGGGKTKLDRILNKVDVSKKLMESVEAQLRVNGFMALLERGIDPARASERVGKAFVDYTMASPTHRTVRNVFPFAQFMIGQTPTTLETLARRPRFATPFRELAKAGEKGRLEALPGLGIDLPGKGDTPMLPEYLANQPTIPLGRDDQGRPRVVGQLGTILDDVNKLQEGDPLTTLRKTVLGSLSPSLKVPLEMATDSDFFFGGKIRYGRTPPALQALGMDPEMDPRVRKLMGLNPLVRQIANVDKLLDERQSWLQKAVNLLTGMKIETVEEDRVLRDTIRGYLEDRVKAGDVGVIERFFARKSVDPQLAAILKEYNRKRKL